MDAHVTITPYWPRAEVPVSTLALTASSATASLFAVPWSLLGVIALLVAAGIGAWYLLRWRRRSRAAEVTEAIQRARRETERRLATASQPANASATASASASSGDAGTGADGSGTGSGTASTGPDGGSAAG